MGIAKSGHGSEGNILWAYASQDGADDCSPFVSRRNKPIYMGSPWVQGYTTLRLCVGGWILGRVEKKKQVKNMRENVWEGCLVR